MKYNFFEIGNRIHDLRRKKKLTQNDFIKLLKNDHNISIGRNRLSNIETGKYQGDKLDLTLLTAICECLGCDIGYILGEYDGITKTATDIQRLTGLSPEAVEGLKSIQEADYYDMRYYHTDNVKAFNLLLANRNFRDVVHCLFDLMRPNEDGVTERQSYEILRYVQGIVYSLHKDISATHILKTYEEAPENYDIGKDGQPRLVYKIAMPETLIRDMSHFPEYDKDFYNTDTD